MQLSGTDRHWLSEYPDYIPGDIGEPQHNSIPELLRETIERHLLFPAYRHLGSQISYEELGTYSSRFAYQLQHKYQLQKGDRVALMMPNIFSHPVSMFGVLKAGGIVVNVNPLYTATELKDLLLDAGARVILIMDAFTSALREIIHETSVEHVIICRVGDLHPGGRRFLLNTYARYISHIKTDADIHGDHFHELIKYSTSTHYQDVSIDRQDIAYLQYTGGTTGKSKGAILTHGNIIANSTQALRWISPAFLTENPCIITALPLYHIFALQANIYVIMRLGGCSHLITNPRDMKRFLKELRNTTFHAITGVNTLFNGMMNHETFKQVNFDSLQLSLAGGMSTQKQTAEDWHAATGCPIVEAYGLTESSPALCANLVHIKAFTGMIGLPLPSTEISIRDSSGHPLPHNSEGEIWARGPQVMQGYWNAPEETANALTQDGWLKTGDIGIMNDQGYIRLIDRKKDMIIISGFNVYPNEVEHILARHPDILEAGVIGIPHESTGEAIKAVIVKKNLQLTEQSVIEHCRKYLTAYKIPKIIEFVDELPKTNVGKILRRALH